MASPVVCPDYIVLAGIPSPGMATVDTGSCPVNWQEQQGFGTDGNSLRFMGASLPTFDVIISLTTPVHYLMWKGFRGMLAKPKPGVPPLAMDISHPLLDDLEIKKCVYKDRTVLKQESPGKWFTKITFQVYKKPKPIVTKPQSVEAAGADAPPAETATDRELREATAAFEAAAARGGGGRP